MKRLSVLLVASLFGVVAVSCGPLFGPAKGKKVKDLNKNQAKRLCKQMKRKADDCDGYEVDYDCGNYKKDFLDNLPDSCEAKAGQFRDCANACGDSGDDGCKALQKCVGFGGSGSSSQSSSNGGSSSSY